MTAVPARVAGVKEIVVTCPRPTPVVLAAALEAGATEVYDNRRRAGDWRAGVRHRDDRTRRQDRRPGQRLGRGRQGTRVARLPDRPARGPQRNRRLLRSRTARVDRGRSHRAGRTRSSRARDSRDDKVASGPGRFGRSRSADAGDGPCAPRPSRATAPSSWRAPGAKRWRWSTVSRRNISSSMQTTTRIRIAPRARSSSANSVCRPPATTARDPITCCRRAARHRFRGGLSASDFVRVFSVQTLTERGLARIGPAGDCTGRSRGAYRCTPIPCGCGCDQRVHSDPGRRARGSISTRTPPAVHPP